MQGSGSRSTKLGVACPALTVSLGLFLSSLLSGCGLLQKVGILSGPEKSPAEIAVALSQQPYQINLKLTASADANPDTLGRPSPVQVRIFIADNQSDVASKSFEELFEFSGNVVEPKPAATVTLRPGQTTSLTIPANKSQTTLVLAAAYRDPYQSIWLAAATIKPLDTVSASASINASTIKIEATP